MTDRIIVQVDSSQVNVLPQIVKVVVQASQIINTGGSSSGTVTSVAATGSDGISVTGGPITTSGTLAFSLGNITPDSVASTGTVTGSNLSGTNTGDQDLSAYAETADLGSAAFQPTSAFATAAQGTTADSAVQPGDNISVLVNDAGYTSNTGTVTSVSVTTANGVSGTVATATTTPAISLVLGAITPTSVAATGSVTGSNLSGTNTGDQDLSGYALTSSLATVATTGSYNDLVDLPTIPSGTVTSVGSGTGLTGGPITSSGTLSLSAGSQASLALADTSVQPGDNVSVLTNDAGYTSNTGTITSVATGAGLTGGPITGTGTVSLSAGSIASLALADSATQPGDLATVATTGDYNDLINIPSGAGVSSFNTRTGAVTLTSGDVTGALTYTPVTDARTVSAGTGLTGGGDLTANRTVSLSSGSIASLALADTSTQPGDNISTLTNDSGFTTNTGTVTSVSVTTANGVSGSVATATTTPAITVTLGAITPTSVAASGTVTGSNLSGTSSGTNTGDQTSVTGNAGTATALQTGRTINGVTFDGTANINLIPRVQTVTYSGTPTVNWANIEISRITLTGNATVTNSGAVDGQKMVLEITQGGSGSYTLGFDSGARYGTDITSVTLSTAVGKMDRIGLIYNATASKYDVVSYVRGF